MGECGAAEAGMEFIGDCGAADLWPALEHERLESGLGQVERGDQAVMAAAEDDDVALSVCCHSLDAPPEHRENAFVDSD